MKGAHRQLGSGFADGLGGNDADRLSQFSQNTGAKVDAVTFLADTALGLARQHGPDLDPVNTGIIYCGGMRLVDDLARFAKVLLRVHRVDDILDGCPAN